MTWTQIVGAALLIWALLAAFGYRYEVRFWLD